MSGIVRIRNVFTSSVAFSLVACAALAAEAQGPGIDADLEGQLDFRDVAFSVCSEQPSCRVGGVEIVAERRAEADAAWVPALIYWDPIDGVGVTDGGQNDEIDFEERIVVRFDTPATVSRLWLSDLFLGEDPRYGATGDSLLEEVSDDVEVADLTLFSGDLEVGFVRVVGDVELPEDPFNEAVSQLFEEDGDLRRRVVLNDEMITVVAPNPQRLDGTILLEAVTGQTDPEKQVIFEGVQTYQIDLTEILAEFDQAELFAFGTTNFDRIQALLGDGPGLAELGRAAAKRRLVGDRDNGEVAAQLTEPRSVDRIEYTAPFDASNDFSVAGVVFDE